MSLACLVSCALVCAGVGRADQIDTLFLAGDPGAFVRPGQPFTVTLSQSGLSALASGFTTDVVYDSARLSLSAEAVTLYPSPFGHELIKTVSDGHIALSAGLASGIPTTQSSAPLASVQFTAGDTDGQTSVGFDAAFSHAFLAPSAPYAAATGSSVSVTVDGTPPEDFAPASQSASPNVYSVSFSTTDAGSGISHYEVKLDEGPYSTQTSPYTVDLSGLPDGQRAVKVKAVDLAGNKRIADLNLVVDHTAPSLLIKGISQNGNDLTLDGASAAAGVVNIQIRASDSASGLKGRPSVTVTPEDRSAEEATFVSVSGDVYNYTYAISTGTTQGIASVDVVVVDKSGNQASVQNRFNVAISQTISAELITQDGDCTNPAIGGNRVVFEKRSIAGGTSNIFLYDLVTKTTRALAPGMNNQQNPRIWQDWVVWQEDGSRGTDIRLCNVKTNAVTTITNTGDCTVPRIADGLISWCRPVDVGTFQVFVVPLATPSAAFAMFGPSVSNSTHHALSLDTLFVVTQNYDLTHLSRVMPVSLIEKRNLSPVGRQKSQSDPSTDGASVVWVEAGASSTDSSVWSRNLRNGGERQVTNSAAERKLPEVAGDIVAWLEKRNGAWEIWASRLSNSAVFPLAVGQAERDNLDADGGHIAWQRVFEDRHVIMLATVDGSPVAIRGMGEGRLFQDNSLISATRQVVTAVFTDRMYVQDPKRSGGMAILGSWALRPGQLVDVTGKMSRDGIERVVTNAQVRPLNELGDVRPITTINKNLGGATVSPYTPTIGAATGLPNTGLLVKSTGKILSVDSQGFFISDITLPAAQFPLGVRVIGSLAYSMNVGSWVTVTGISTTALVGNVNYPAIRELTGVSLAQYQSQYQEIPTYPIIFDGFITGNRTWMIAFGARLYYSDDWLQSAPILKYIFPTGSDRLTGLFVTSQGTIFVSSKGNGIVYRSTDNGSTFMPVFTMPLSGSTAAGGCGLFNNWGFDEGPDGTLYMGQYHFQSVTTNSAYLFWSSDNGTTWNPFPAWNSAMAGKRRHIHQVKVDQFGSPRVWWSCGDAKRETYYSDDKGLTYHLLMPHLSGGQTGFTWVGQTRLWGDDLPRWDSSLPNVIKSTTDDVSFKTLYTPQSVNNVPIYDLAATEDGKEVWGAAYEGGADFPDRRGALVCSTNGGQSFFVFGETQDYRTLGIDFDYYRIFRGRHGIIPSTCPYIFVVPTQDETQKRVIRIQRITAP